MISYVLLVLLLILYCDLSFTPSLPWNNFFARLIRPGKTEDVCRSVPSFYFGSI